MNANTNSKMIPTRSAAPGRTPSPTAQATARSAHRRLFTGLLFAATMLALAGATSAAAQGVHEYSFPGSSGTGGSGTSTGGRVYSGTSVPTGRSSLFQPVPPAASAYYSHQRGRAGTATNPSPYPFGTQ